MEGKTWKNVRAMMPRSSPKDQFWQYSMSECTRWRISIHHRWDAEAAHLRETGETGLHALAHRILVAGEGEKRVMSGMCGRGPTTDIVPSTFRNRGIRRCSACATAHHP